MQFASYPSQTEVVGRWRLTQKIADTRSGEIFEAHDQYGEITTRVLVKAIANARDDQDWIRVAATEAATARRLRQAGVPAVVDSIFRPDRGQLYVVSQRVPGFSLEELLEDRRRRGAGGFDERVVCSLGLALLRILHTAHTHPDGAVVRRDISTRSVMVDRRGKTWLLDGGLPAASRSLWRTPSEDLLGTAGFTAPELASRDRVDILTDLYSVACVIHAAATLSVPARGRGAGPRTARMSDELWRVIARGLEDDRERRWSSAADFVLALAGLCKASERTHSIETLRASVAELEDLRDAVDGAETRRAATPAHAPRSIDGVRVTPATGSRQPWETEATVEYALPPDLGAIFGPPVRVGRPLGPPVRVGRPPGPRAEDATAGELASDPGPVLQQPTTRAAESEPLQPTPSDVAAGQPATAAPHRQRRPEQLLSVVALLVAAAAIALR